MNNNDFELRTLPRKTSDPGLKKSYFGRADFEVTGKRSQGLRPRPKSLNAGSSYNLNSKRSRKPGKDMYNNKKTEKKAGLREWFFGKTAKTHKPKLANPPKQEAPIVERLQKQSAYVRATLESEVINDRSSSPTTATKAQNDENYTNFDEFTHKKHLLQIHARPTWCDVCEDFIWGIYRSAVRCKCE